MPDRNPEELLKRYQAGNVTPEEKALVEDWLLGHHFQGTHADPDIRLLEQYRRTSIRKLQAGIRPLSARLRPWGRVAAAACVLAVIGLGIFFGKDKRPPAMPHPVAQALPAAALLPGSNKALLILSDGRQIQVEAAATGEIAREGNASIRKTATGQVVYGADNAPSTPGQEIYNTAVTPRGGQYQLVLSDGTSVWLNAASSLRFPVHFTGSVREVSLSGEAYFEVANHPQHPFRVISNHQVTEVLGTHFNMNAYDDEPMEKTTLLQGSVRVTANGASRLIKPGEQALLQQGQLTVSQADISQAIAWKEGYFDFNNADLKTVMRQFSRWYNVDVKYEAPVPQRFFSGRIPRNINASQLLDILAFKQVHYRLENKTIIIQ
ncbi:MAG TPA: FecR domain-containing protein [Chitinophaga sp.]